MQPQKIIVTLGIISAVCLLNTRAALAEETPWHLGSENGLNLSAPSSLNTSTVSPGPHEIVVALIDAGILSNHPSIQDNVLSGYDMLSAPLNLRGGRSIDFSPDERGSSCNGKTSPNLNRTHGTELASLIAGNGSYQVHGVNKSAKILPVRLFGSCPFKRQDLLDALAWAAGIPVANTPINSHPAQVINMSFSGGATKCSPELQAMLDSISSKGIFVVAAAGNRFGKSLLEPANCKGVISVGAINFNNQISNYSALDPRTSIYAPGGEVNSQGVLFSRDRKLKVASFETNSENKELPISANKGVGTSYSSSLVSGFISLLLSWNPKLTPEELMNSLELFSREVERSSKCPECNPRGLTMIKINPKQLATKNH